MAKVDEWPAWYYGPDNQSGIFQDAKEVPAGWVDHPSKVKAPKASKSQALDL